MSRLLEPNQGILLARDIADGKVKMRTVSAVLRSRQFRDQFYSLEDARRSGVFGNMHDLLGTGRAICFPDDPAYEELICKPIRELICMPDRNKPGDEAAKREFFRHGIQFPEE